MKRILRNFSFLLFTVILISSCTEEKTGESPKQIAETIEVDLPEDKEDAASKDTLRIVEPIVVPRPVPPKPPIDPIYPKPDPCPFPERDPIRPGPPFPPPPPIQPDPTFDFAEVEPAFPGGAEAMVKFIVDNIQYPETAKELGDQGRVYVAFVVEKDGSLSNIEVLRGVSVELDREAKRVIRSMPKWKPGEQQGKVVRCRMRLPVTFTLN